MDPEFNPNRPQISVVIPAYRAEATIRRAIDSVLAQPEVNVRIIVVVDGIFDRTAELIADYSSEQVVVHSHDINKGAAVSRNDGLALVDSEYVMFLDADDFIEGPLLQGLSAAVSETGADLGFGPMQILHETRGEREEKYVPDFSSSEDVLRKWHLGGVFVTPCSILWRAEFLRGIGSWDPEVTRNDDGELVMRAILKGAKFVVSDRGCGIYVKHSMESLNNRTDNMDSMLRVNEKLLAIQSPVIDPELQRYVCAGHYFNIASHGYLSGRDDLGDEALKRSRKMGFGTRGPLPHRLAYALLGVKRTCRLIARVKRYRAAGIGR
ncbi:MAG: glycosyltransferase family 2 protein [Pseudomonadota bacterium]|nr:glycosyltransferase family 2 protein [Pseudomonadota bacterium]